MNFSDYFDPDRYLEMEPEPEEEEPEDEYDYVLDDFNYDAARERGRFK